MDLTIPGHPFSFGVLNDAQSLGDFQALVASGRRSVRVNLGADVAAGVFHLLEELA